MDEIYDSIGTGTVLGAFEIEKELGRGGMGVVYKAHEPSLNRKVAVKVLSEMLSSNEEYIARFRKEAQIIATLNHPNIVGVLSFGKDLGRYYFAMEYIKGRDLGQILKEKTVIPIEEALSIARQIASALSEAGKKGVVHRDLKPSNIMIDEMGRVRITDFGVARLEGSTDGLTQTGMFLGTPEYASPEQATGKPIDTRSDIYALGALLYRMLSGKPPIVGDSPLAVVAKIATEPVTPIGLLNSSIPKPVCDLIGKMMAKDLRDRFQSPEEVHAVIDGLEKGASADQTISSPPALQKSGSGRYWIGGLLLAAIALFVLYIGKERFFPNQAETFKETAQVSVTEVESPTSAHTQTAGTTEAGAPLPETPSIEPGKSLSGSLDGTQSSPGRSEVVQVEPTLTSLDKTVPASTDLSVPHSTPNLLDVQSVPVAQKEPRVLPETPTVLILVSGPEDMQLLMLPYLESAVFDSGLRAVSPVEIPMLREKMQFGDLPVSWYSIRQFVPIGAADILVLATMQSAGTTELKFYGRSQEQTTAVFSIRTLDMDTGEAINRSVTGQVKYTALNMDDMFQETIAGSLEDFGDTIKTYWRTKRGSKSAGS